MSDYMFKLESHLSPDQNRVLAQVQAAAAEAGMSVFLAGGAMRDIMGGFPVRDLDFTVEGNALKLARSLARQTGAEITLADERRKCAAMLFPGRVSVEIAMARQERFAKPGAPPQVEPATIHEDLRRRDFTINAVALSLTRASRGLLIDPTNGLGDLERKELRAVHNYTLYDDPARILRLVRFRVRLGLTVEERTAQQYQNVRAEGLERCITARRLLEELREIAEDPNPAELLRALDEEKLLALFSPSLAAGKLNLAGLARLHKARQLVPYGFPFPVDNMPLLLSLMTEKLTTREKSALVAATGMPEAEVSRWHKLDGRAARLERELKSPKLHKPFPLYEQLVAAPGELVLFLLAHSSLRLVQDRIRNFFLKYLPAALEITDQDVVAKGGQPGTPKFLKLKNELIQARLNARPPHPAPEEPVPAPEPVPEQPRATRRPDARQPKVSRS